MTQHCNPKLSEQLSNVETYDCAFLEPLALPPDLPPPVIVIEFGIEMCKNVVCWAVENVEDAEVRLV